MELVNASADHLRGALLEQLPAAARDGVQRMIAGAGDRPVFAVGGVVRDLIIGRPIVDVDLVIEGDALAVIDAAMPGAKLRRYEAFGTASVEVDNTRIDVAMARREAYPQPGALPVVEPATIAEDLRRRDFTMNAIAMRLNASAELLDPCGGIADIAARIVRVLHDGSFVDDATRIFRALRYAARLSFAIDPHTVELMRRDITCIATIGGERIRHELALMLTEATGAVALSAAEYAGALSAVHPAISWDGVRGVGLAARPVDVDELSYGFALLAAGASTDEAVAIAERLRLTRDESAAVRAIAGLQLVAPMLRRSDAKPSGVVILLDHYPAAGIAAFGGATSDPIVRQLALRYLDEWRHVRPLLGGDALIEMGVPRGPQVHRGLQLIRAARLDGWATDLDDERALALRFIKSINDSSAAQTPMDFHINDN